MRGANPASFRAPLQEMDVLEQCTQPQAMGLYIALAIGYNVLSLAWKELSAKHPHPPTLCRASRYRHRVLLLFTPRHNAACHRRGDIGCVHRAYRPIRNLAARNELQQHNVSFQRNLGSGDGYQRFRCRRVHPGTAASSVLTTAFGEKYCMRLTEVLSLRVWLFHQYKSIGFPARPSRPV